MYASKFGINIKEYMSITRVTKNLIVPWTPDYLEYAYTCAPSDAGQLITTSTSDVNITLFLNSEIADTGDYGVLSAGTLPAGGSSATSAITLAAGKYNFEAHAPVYLQATAFPIFLGLYNNTTSKWITRGKKFYTDPFNTVGSTGPGSGTLEIDGSFTVAADTTNAVSLRMYTNTGGKALYISNAGWNGSLAAFTSTTPADQDQRTTIKLWKVE